MMLLLLLNHVRLFATPWAVAPQAPLSVEFSRPEYWSGLPIPLPGDLPDPVIKPASPALEADSLPIEPFWRIPTHTHIHMKLQLSKPSWPKAESYDQAEG